MDNIMTYEEWKNLPGKTWRKEALITLRRNFSDKDIRDAWELKPDKWYNLVSRNMKGESVPGRPPQHRGRPPAEPSQEEFVQNDAVPSDHRWPRKNVVDAEYQVVEQGEEVEVENLLDNIGYFNKKAEDEQKEMHRERAKENGWEPVPADLPFPTIKGTPEQLRKQFEGIALFLEGLEGEDTRFEIRISAVKA